MAITVNENDLPEVGDKIIEVERSEDGRVAWIKTEKGKVAVAHVAPPDRGDFTELPSSKQINEEVSLNFRRAGKIYGTIQRALFSIGKVRYDVSLTLGNKETTVIRDVDSAFVEKCLNASDVAFFRGKAGLDRTYQNPFPETTSCCRCEDGEARIGLVIQERAGEAICDVHKNDPDGEGYWPHDPCAIAIYFCKNCLKPTALFNQA